MTCMSTLPAAVMDPALVPLNSTTPPIEVTVLLPLVETTTPSAPQNMVPPFWVVGVKPEGTVLPDGTAGTGPTTILMTRLTNVVLSTWIFAPAPKLMLPGLAID